MPTHFILVRPQMGENIGFCARAMANFGLRSLRIVAPRDGWPNEAANRPSAGALQDGHIDVQVFDTLEAAVADCHYVYATTARERALAKPVNGPREAAQASFQRQGRGLSTAILFGPERSGLSGDDIALANAIITFPVNPEFSSLNLGQAALLMAYELYQAQGDDEGELLPFVGHQDAPPANSQMIQHFLADLQARLDARGYFTPAERADVMKQNLQALFMRMDLTEQDVKSLFAVVKMLG